MTELHGRTFSCIDGCALCCLCQPELLSHERRVFQGDPKLSAGVASTHMSPDVNGAALRLVGGHGACYFLDGRRCGVYEHRPHFCRSFPLNVFVGWRVQLNVNMSCRGLGRPGERLVRLGEMLLSEYGEVQLGHELSSANDSFTRFESNAREERVAQSFSSVRHTAEMLKDELTDGIGLSRVMTHAEYGQANQDSPPADIARLVRETEAEADISERALMDGVELFDLPNLSLLPIYVGPDLSWKIFRLEGSSIVARSIDDSGEALEFCRIDPASVNLLPMTASGRRSLQGYLATLNARDCLLGHAAYLCDIEGYEFNFGQVYLGTLANSVIDLWWRASLLAQLAGVEQLGQEEIKEGIVFFDMDILDLPTIGSFI
ncbi:MAG: YkgJ family cysteine cluster protein [Methanobacteriota archaeon]|nr:MAG: YkgJ family cysteine cluster protein [Euryarchaeota archaeon]